MVRKKRLAVIPARGGSKGVPGKNIKILAGKPLIGYTIDAALESGVFDKVIVSTDDEKIRRTAEKCGAEAPFLRPKELSGDGAASDDVVLHALAYLEEQGEIYEEVCKLQPTSPLRKAVHIKEACALFQERKAKFLVSVCECEHSPLWCGTLPPDLRMDDFLPEELKRSSRQELPIYYRLNGAIYLGNTAEFRKNKSFLGKDAIAFIMAQRESIDIDSLLDFQIAECLLQGGEEDE